jgi:hypothetical protein
MLVESENAVTTCERRRFERALDRENQRLQAELRARMEELRRSSARIVSPPGAGTRVRAEIPCHVAPALAA